MVCLLDAICKPEAYDPRKGSYSQSHCLGKKKSFSKIAISGEKYQNKFIYYEAQIQNLKNTAFFFFPG